MVGQTNAAVTRNTISAPTIAPATMRIRLVLVFHNFPCGCGWMLSTQCTSSGFSTIGDVEVHDDRLLAAAHQHARQRLVVARVDLLVRHVRRHVDEVARARFGDELELVAPAHARAPLTT